MILNLIIMSLAIFLVGTFEIMRNDYMFTIVEDNFMNENATTNTSLANYNTLKADFIFTNEPFILLLNYGQFIALVMLFSYSAYEGFNSRPMNLKDTMINYSLVLILVFYLLIILFNYLANIFVDQLLVVLFNDILSEVYMFNLFINYFIGIFLIAVLINFIANQIRYFKAIDI